ncbi:hypothetical protein [[Phormidium] sp. ETS-05]|uniref:hypothetical protein n=1 Tax=[Phormidium] sp. ETS-05 TaxID=222819 RepID=UPI0018EF2512|nr:hypothetical protein [[Phormidium] sp. ETS-05]
MPSEAIRKISLFTIDIDRIDYKARENTEMMVSVIPPVLELVPPDHVLQGQIVLGWGGNTAGPLVIM